MDAVVAHVGTNRSPKKLFNVISGHSWLLNSSQEAPNRVVNHQGTWLWVVAVPALTRLHEGEDALGLAAPLQLILLQLVAVEAEAHHHVALWRPRRAQLLEALSSH